MSDTVMQSLLERVGRRVRDLRSARGFTAKETASRAGLSPRFYSDLEGGKANIAIGRLDAVARALEVSLEDLVRDRAPGAGERDRSEVIGLLGLRGAGKSSLGRLAADSLGLEFVELDEHIEEAAGLSLPEIFALHSEAYYRRLTLQCLRALLDSGRPCVIALPGGVLHDEEAHQLLRRRCTTVWLKARPQDHMDRVVGQGDERPMAGRRDAMAELRSILATREPLYRQADLIVDTSGREQEEAAAELAAAVQGARPSG
jgi:XRE family aerobic/anaerobic benzoate catabolism transcriptional regulator